MKWKSFFLLTFVNCAMSFNRNSFKTAEVHPYLELIDRTYDTRPKPVDVAEDVGEPLLLTPFIENQQITEARNAARINATNLLPGIESYAGYLTVNKRYNGNLWFWYFPNKKTNVSETPLILWLQGGPGASSLYGLFVEIGPFFVLTNGTLAENKYSWGENFSLLFIDNPVGAGFSFTDEDGYTTNQDTIGENLYTGLQQFMTMFPELRTAPLFIAGESYAGKHIPSIGIQIHYHKNQNEPINLQGLAIGNGFIDPVSLLRYSYFGREVGLVGDKTADEMKRMEAVVAKTIGDNETEEAFYMYGALLNELMGASELATIYNYLEEKEELFGAYTQFVQRPEIRRALHVGSIRFSRPGSVYYNLRADIMNSAKPWLEELLEHYPVLVYSGHLDCIVPYHASVNTYSTLNYSGAQKYKQAERSAWFHNKTLAGYVKKGGNLLEVMVRGAGHMVPVDRPAAARALLTAFVRGEPLAEDLDTHPLSTY